MKSANITWIDQYLRARSSQPILSVYCDRFPFGEYVLQKLTPDEWAVLIAHEARLVAHQLAFGICEPQLRRLVAVLDLGLQLHVMDRLPVGEDLCDALFFLIESCASLEDVSQPFYHEIAVVAERALMCAQRFDLVLQGSWIIALMRFERCLRVLYTLVYDDNLSSEQVRVLETKRQRASTIAFC